MKRLLILCGIFLFYNAMSQAPASYTSADIYLGLKKLNVLGSVLYVAAHPDDENTRLLAYFSKDQLYRTGYLSMTRGDGGQNLIGEEQGVELGMIRTQELLAARQVDGGRQRVAASAFPRLARHGDGARPVRTVHRSGRCRADPARDG